RGPGWPAPLQVAAYGIRQWQFFDWCARRYGDPFTVRLLGGTPAVHFAGPEAIKQIFALGREQFVVGEASKRMLAPFVGPRSILMIDGDAHKRERKMMVHAFHAEAFAVHEATMTEVTEAHFARWPRGEVFLAHPAMQALTLDVMLRVAFGV